MSLLPSNLSKDIETPNGSLKFTPKGIVISVTGGNQITLGPTGIELTCGGTTIKMTQGDIVINTAASSLKLSQGDSSLSSPGPIRLNGAMVNINNGALEVL